jgi:hypothetical protein
MSTVMAARYVPEPPKSTVPRLPRGVFFSLLFSVVPLVKGWCGGFLPDSTIFVTLLVITAISTGIWLMAASALKNSVDVERKARIEEFISSAPGEEPPRRPNVDPFPKWLQVWEAINFAAYLLLLAMIIYPLAI